MTLYAGPLLGGCGEEWVFQEREAREVAYLNALETLASQAGAKGDHAAAIGHLRRLVAVDPLRESAYRGLMESLAAEGDFGEATATYRKLRSLLRDELQAEPSPETTQLYQRLRTEARGAAASGPRPLARPDPAAPTPPTVRLPHLPTPFVGREREVQEVLHCLDATRMVTLSGPGGVAKTRLATFAAREAAKEYPGGAWFVDLALVSESGRLARALAAVLEVPESAGRSSAEALLSFLQPRSLLLVLDNCEHVAGACADLARSLLRECPLLRILATSQHVPQGLPGHGWSSVSCRGSRRSVSLPSERVPPGGMARGRRCWGSCARPSETCRSPSRTGAESRSDPPVASAGAAASGSHRSSGRGGC